MPFIGKRMAFQLLRSMSKGTCTGSCRQVWLRNIQYALKTPTNPLHLTATERKQMEAAVAAVKGRRGRVTQKAAKKYASRPSPPLPANEHCGETQKGNDGQMYVSVPNKRSVCRWTLKRSR
jgi:hypothetical protein